MNPVRASVADRIYESLKADIFEFRLIPGDRFSENEVAARLQTSRTPVREALFRLQREGYVDVLFRSGWKVKPLDFDYFEELYDLRIILEVDAVRKLCRLGQVHPIVESLLSLWRPESASLAQPAANKVSLLDENFHSQLVQAGGNKEIARIHHQLTERLRVIRRLDFTQPTRIDATYSEHHTVLQHIIRNQPEEAVRLLSAHIRQSQSAVRDITMERIRQAAQMAPDQR